MRKVAVTYGKDEKSLRDRVEAIYREAEEKGYEILGVQYLKPYLEAWTAFIDYETNPEKKKARQ